MVHEHREQNWLIMVSLVIIAAVALAAALMYTRVAMVPFVVALFIVALVSPIEDFQVKCLRLPRAVAIVVTLLVVVAVIALVFLLIAQATTIIVSTAGEYSARFAYMADKILEPIEYIYRKEEPRPPVAPNDTTPKPAAAPNDMEMLLPPVPKEAKPAPAPTGPVELVPVVDDAGKAATAFADRLPILPLLHRSVRIYHRDDVRGLGFDASSRLGFADLFFFGKPAKSKRKGG